MDLWVSHCQLFFFFFSHVKLECDYCTCTQVCFTWAQELCSLWNICCMRVAWPWLLGVDSSWRKQVSRSSLLPDKTSSRGLALLTFTTTYWVSSSFSWWLLSWVNIQNIYPFPEIRKKKKPKLIAPKWVGPKSGRDRWGVNCQPVGGRLKSLAGGGGSNKLNRNGQVGWEETGTWDQDQTCWVSMRNMGYAN